MENDNISTEVDTDTTGQEVDTDASTSEDGEGSAQPSSTADAVRRALAGDDDNAGEPPAAGTEGGEPAKADDKTEEDPEKAKDAELEPPPGLKEASRQRFEALANRVKEAETRYSELDTKHKELETQHKQVVDVWEGTGASPQQFAEMLMLLTDMNSGDPERQMTAFQRVEKTYKDMARHLGIGNEALAAYPDLADRVQKFELSEQDALELARSRRQNELRSQRAEQGQQTQKQQQEQQARVDTAQKSLADLGSQLRKADPDFQSKLDILNKRGFFDRLANSAQPESWSDLFQTAYDALGEVASSVRVAPPKKEEQPLRRTLDGGGGNPKPKTIRDAVMLAINESDN
jgi:hypothetical protein